MQYDQVGGRIFLRMPMDQKKLAIRNHKQTVPLPVKKKIAPLDHANFSLRSVKI